MERAVGKAEKESTGWWRGGVTQVLVLFHQKKYEGRRQATDVRERTRKGGDSYISGNGLSFPVDIHTSEYGAFKQNLRQE